MTLGDRVCVMAGGLKRQCASPLEVYQHPADRFVAGFLGMPPMNFLSGKLEHSGGEFQFRNQDVHLMVDNSNGLLTGETTGEVVAGLRPEALHLEGLDSAPNSVHATVQVVEPLGSLMDVYLQLGSGQRLVCRTPARPVGEGSQVTLRVNPGDVHLFSPASSADPFGISLRSTPALVATA